MMKKSLFLYFLAALPLMAQAAADVSALPVVTLEGWGRLMLPVPPGYEAVCRKGEDHFVFSLEKPKQKPALEIYNGFAPTVTEAGDVCYAEIAGKRRKGVIVPQEEGGTAHEFLLEDGAAGSVYLITLPGGDDSALMSAVLAALRWEDDPSTSRRSPAKEEPPAADAPATAQTFKCKGAFSLMVPEDLRVKETRDGDAYLFHFLSPAGERVLCIYCGYAPLVQTGGKPCTAVIAGKRREGNLLSGEVEPSAALAAPLPGKAAKEGEEYVLPGGAEGALYHIMLYDTPRRSQMLSMLAGMSMSGGSPLPESAQQQSAALRESAEACVRQANIILAQVKDRAGADAAVAALRPLADTMQANDKAAAALQKRYGRALHAYLHAPDKPNSELSPATKRSKEEPENEIQRVHEADCYGSQALEDLLLRFMGIDND